MATRGKKNKEPPATSPVNFRVGEFFKSYKELEEKIKTYEQSNSVQLWMREARTVTSANKRVDRYLTSELASVVSEYSGYHFDRKMKLLRELIDSWKFGQEVALVDVDESMLLTITFNYY